MARDRLNQQYSGFVRSEATTSFSSSICRYADFNQEIKDLFVDAITHGLTLRRTLTFSPNFSRILSLDLPSCGISGTALYQSRRLFAMGTFNWKDGKLDAVFASKPTMQTLLHMTTGLKPGPFASFSGDLTSSLEYRARNSTHSLDVSSSGSIYGWKYSRRVGQRWCVGNEIYYTATENSGGMSLGIRYTSDNNNNGWVGTCIINPIMGHFRLSLVTQLFPKLTLGSYYLANAHSYESDLGVAMCYRSTSSKHTSINNGEDLDEIKISFSTQNAIKLLVTMRLSSSLKFSAGIQTQVTDRPRTIMGAGRKQGDSEKTRFGFSLTLDP